MPRVVLAPDKFQGTVTATEVAKYVGAGVRAGRPDVKLVRVSVADGCDGTLAAAYAAGFERVVRTASGPLGLPVVAVSARRADAATVELAAVSGLALAPDRAAPLAATTVGTGELVRDALELGWREIVLGVGGPASTDGKPVPLGGAALSRATTLDLSCLHPRLAGARIVVACGVNKTLLGPRGAAAVYGPQRGSGTQQVRELDAALIRWTDLVATATGRDLRDVPGAGAAAGVGFAALALLGATLERGAELTGEGSLDEQTLHAADNCGHNGRYFLTDLTADAAELFGNPGPLLRTMGQRIAHERLPLHRD